jgi:hypothetical protein
MGETAPKCYMNEEKGEIVDCIDPNTETYKHDCTKCPRYTRPEAPKSEFSPVEQTPSDTSRYMTRRQYAFERTALLGFGLMLLTYGLQIFQLHYTQRDATAYQGMLAGVFWAVCGLVCWGLYVYLSAGGGRHDKDFINFISSKECKEMKQRAIQATVDAMANEVSKVADEGTEERDGD